MRSMKRQASLYDAKVKLSLKGFGVAEVLDEDSGQIELAVYQRQMQADGSSHPVELTRIAVEDNALAGLVVDGREVEQILSQPATLPPPVASTGGCCPCRDAAVGAEDESERA